jgi:hypothetical protein
MRISLSLPGHRPARPTPLYIFTWTSLVFSVLIFVGSVLDLGLWMNMSAAVATTIYHIGVLVLSSRSPDVPPGDIFTSISTAGCAAILIFAWLAAFAMTILALVVGRDEFPGPPPLIEMAFPIHVALGALTGLELVLVIIIARLSGFSAAFLAAPAGGKSALQRRIEMRPSTSARRLLGV